LVAPTGIPFQPCSHYRRGHHLPTGICRGSTSSKARQTRRYALGDEYSIKDPATGAPALRNPFWSRPPDAKAPAGVSTLQEFVNRGAVILVCDFAMGHLANRLASKAGRTAAEVHQDLRVGLVSGAYAVPSRIFGLARAQNAGCAFIRM